MSRFDRLIKLAALLTLLAFLWVAWTAAQNGRYAYPSKSEYSPRWIIDTRTGRLFYPQFGKAGDQGVIEVQPDTGRTVMHWLWWAAKKKASASKDALDDLLNQLPPSTRSGWGGWNGESDHQPLQFRISPEEFLSKEGAVPADSH